jgi:hypothetical protein
MVLGEPQCVIERDLAGGKSQDDRSEFSTHNDYTKVGMCRSSLVRGSSRPQSVLIHCLRILVLTQFE